jgi:zinc transport system substrate-binding protein
MNTPEPNPSPEDEGPNLKFAAIAGTVVLSIMLLAVVFLRESPHLAEQRHVLATIPPLHSLVSTIMGESGTPVLLLPGGTSSHGHSLRPSENEAFYRAQLIIWVDPAVETSLPQMINHLPNHIYLLKVGSLDGMTLLPPRRGGLWQSGGEEVPTAQGETAADHDHDHDDGNDPHVWLDPLNAIVWVNSITNNLSTLDPPNAIYYRENADTLIERLQALDAELREQLMPFTDVPYLVYHDAYQYFEARYGLDPVGAFTLSADRPISARRYAELQAVLRDGGVKCLFVEPQFPPQQVERLVEETGVTMAYLDPLGVGLIPGPELYFRLMRGLGDSLATCLGGS